MNSATIESVLPASPLAAHARTLFRQYGDFLRQTQACGTFNFLAYEDETRTLPTPYTSRNGEVLLALIDGQPAACIVYRATTQDARTAEIKRLFVAPAFRNQGLARTLVTETLARINTRAFTRIILDTDIVNMPGAMALYQSFGFREYGTRQGNIAFLELLPQSPQQNPLP